MPVKRRDYEADILNASILIVDDKTANVLLLELMLGRAGYTSVSSTQDPTAVFDLYKKNCYDLIILDLQMPVMDGFQVMVALKELELDGYIPILVITAQPFHKVRALQLGAKDFISKPFDQVEVLLRIHNMLEIRLLHQESKRYSQILEEKVEQRTETLKLAMQDLAEVNKSLKKQYIASIRSFSRTIEMRPGIKSGQSKYIAENSLQIARQLGLNEEEKKNILYAGLLMQIGKMGLPDSVLSKPYYKIPLADKQSFLKHAVNGEALLKGLTQLKGASLLIRHQYERYDGSGFPDHLAKQNIPMGSRIISVVRDYIAFLEGSETGAVMSVKDALAKLMTLKQSYYDPDVIDTFLNILKATNAEPTVVEAPLVKKSWKNSSLMGLPGNGVVVGRPIIEISWGQLKLGMEIEIVYFENKPYLKNCLVDKNILNNINSLRENTGKDPVIKIVLGAK